MSQAEQAQKGFKTFILTLSISLIVFSAVYYVITNSSLGDSAPDIDSSTSFNEEPTKETVFGKLADQEPTTQARTVLAGEDVADDSTLDEDLSSLTEDTNQPTQASGTPQGGVTSITMGLFTSIAVFMYGLFVISRDPRKLALKGFEEDITRDL